MGSRPVVRSETSSLSNVAPVPDLGLSIIIRGALA